MGHAPLGITEPFGGGNEGLWENLHLFRVYGSPDGTDIMAISPREMTRSLALSVKKKLFFGGADR